MTRDEFIEKCIDLGLWIKKVNGSLGGFRVTATAAHEMNLKCVAAYKEGKPPFFEKYLGVINESA